MTGSRSWRSHRLFSEAIFPLIVVITIAVFTAGACVAQDAQRSAPTSLPSAPSAETKTPTAADNVRVTVPVGTSIPLVLTRPLDSRSIRGGDAVFAQISNPVMVGDQVAIPAGTFVRGKVQELRRNGTRGELFLRSAALVMGSEVVDMGGAVKIESEEWTAWNRPSTKSSAAIILVPLLAMPLGSLIGRATDGKTTTYVGGTPFTTQSHKGLVIGTTVGFAAGLGTSLALIAHSRGFYLEEGAPLHLTLQTPVALSGAQIANAEHNPAPVQIIRRTRPWPSPGNNPPIAFPESTPATGPSSCSAGQQWCMGSCKSTIDFVSDNNNCGRCGNSCRIGESCTGGMCMKQP